MSINLLMPHNIPELLILLLFMHVLSDLRSGFIQTQYSCLRSEPNLIFKEISQFFERYALVGRSINPPDDSE